MENHFIEGIKIKHADWPYILTGFFLVVLISLIPAGWVGPSAGLFTLVSLSLLYILIYVTHLYRRIRRDLRDQQQKQQAYFSLFHLHDFNTPLPYMTDWAATPELALVITDIIRRKKPEMIVELGGGISTLISAMNMTRLGRGNVLALDHDSAYAKRCREKLKERDLDTCATVKHAPLVSTDLPRGEWTWYDLSDVRFDKPIDLLIVDGPPVKTQTCARYPALPLLIDHLNREATVIVHDAHRKAEKTMLKWWKEEHPEMQIETIDSEKGIAILTMSRDS